VLTGAVLDEPPVTGPLGAELDDTEPDAGAEDAAGGLDDTGGGGVDLPTLGLGAGAGEPQSDDALAGEPAGAELPLTPGLGVAVPLGVTDGDGSGVAVGLTGGEVLAGPDGAMLAEPVFAGGPELVTVLAEAPGEQVDAAAGADEDWWRPGVVG
jgi:hypothetical protein